MACINIMKINDAKKEFSIFFIESTDEIKIILTNSHQRKQRYYLAVMTFLRKKIKNRAPPVYQPSQTLFKKRLYFNVIYCHYDCIVKFIFIYIYIYIYIYIFLTLIFFFLFNITSI